MRYCDTFEITVVVIVAAGVANSRLLKLGLFENNTPECDQSVALFLWCYFYIFVHYTLYFYDEVWLTSHDILVYVFAKH